MSTAEFFINKSPPEVAQIKTLIELDGGKGVATAQADGRMTVTAVFPDAAGEAPQPVYLIKAAEELQRGVVETVGSGSNPRIEEYHRMTGGIATDDVAWCSAFVNFCVIQSGLQGTNSKMARSWTSWGVAAPALVPGCIVVLSRDEPTQGHVGFFVGETGGKPYMLAGNQGNRVSVDAFDRARLIATRQPDAAATQQPAAPPLAAGQPEPHDVDVDTMARTLWGEARGEQPPEAIPAVASVIVNRYRLMPRFGGSIDGVCKKSKQFSCWNDGDPNLPKMLAVTSADPIFVRCQGIAARAADGQLKPDATSGATHYHAENVSPDWAVGHQPCARIGHHLFYNDIR